MRKVEQQITTALREHRNFSGGNTLVTWTGEDCTVLLHGHKIAELRAGRLALDWCRGTRPRLGAA